jgi:hypothetical protein
MIGLSHAAAYCVTRKSNQPSNQPARRQKHTDIVFSELSAGFGGAIAAILIVICALRLAASTTHDPAPLRLTLGTPLKSAGAA